MIALPHIAPHSVQKTMGNEWRNMGSIKVPTERDGGEVASTAYVEGLGGSEHPYTHTVLFPISVLLSFPFPFSFLL